MKVKTAGAVLTLCGLLAVLTGAGTADTSGSQEAAGPQGIGALLKRAGYWTIPLERRKNSNYLWLTVGLAGQDARFVVDSAATYTTIDTAVAQRLKLPLVGTTGTLGGLGGSDLGASASLWPTLKVSGHDVPLPYVMVADLGHVNKGAAGDRGGADRWDSRGGRPGPVLRGGRLCQPVPVSP